MFVNCACDRARMDAISPSLPARRHTGPTRPLGGGRSQVLCSWQSWCAGWARTCPSIANHHQPIIAGFTTPGFAGAPEHLPHIGAALVAREGLVALGDRIEALDRVRCPICRPHPVLVVDIDRIGARLALRHREVHPDLLLRIVTADAA